MKTTDTPTGGTLFSYHVPMADDATTEGMKIVSISARQGPIFIPRSKFFYPAGGLDHPHHAGGPAAGSKFELWSFEAASPGKLRDRVDRHAGAPNVKPP